MIRGHDQLDTAHAPRRPRRVGRALADRRRETEARPCASSARRGRAARAQAVRAQRRHGGSRCTKKASPRVARTRPRAASAAAQARRGAPCCAESISDEFDAETLLETDDGAGLSPPGDRPRRRAQAAPRRTGHPGPDRPARPAPRGSARGARRIPARCRRARACAACAWCTARATARPAEKPVLKGKVHRWLVQRERGAGVHAGAGDRRRRGALVVLLKPQPGLRASPRDA